MRAEMYKPPVIHSNRHIILVSLEYARSNSEVSRATRLASIFFPDNQSCFKYAQGPGKGGEKKRICPYIEFWQLPHLQITLQ